ncbi:HAD-IA family hydrolase [Halostagnicola sp. A-GB9-2]|uniref:HAD family hydrolase n=1 Tax=Halostagnicola sp. A-GB9-2 TaxID=3048066 RepID=UPI0024C016B7|nr:HAD-IA family hydrolase [Halostagnicola sp. A-GB9-2]MDJ1431089.1 HAD-IA family hydrolase [Halostagnicola sp. A-GB9-2]
MEAILFDMDGIILEGPRTDPQVYADATEYALAELDVDPSPEQREDFRRFDTGVIADRAAAHGIDPDEFWKLRDDRASALTHERVRTGKRDAYNDIEALYELANRTTIALVTNNRHRTAEFVEEHFEFGFETVRGRDPSMDGYRRRKPNPAYLEATLDELCVDAGLYVGDSGVDIIAGYNAGLETAFVRRPHNRSTELPSEPTYELDSLTELLDLLEASNSQ